MKCFEIFYLLYLWRPQYVIFFYNQIFENAQILPDVLFCLKICHNFKSYQNMLTISNLIFLYYKLKVFYKQHIHCITFICQKKVVNFF
jgi:hypothetical protein